MSRAAAAGGKTRVTQQLDGALWHVQLSAPKGNVLDAAMTAELTETFVRARTARHLKAIVLSGEGAHFSFGASVEEHRPQQVAAMLHAFHELFRRMFEASTVVFAAVRGQCLGGGLELACGGNLLFAAPDAQLGQPELKLGVFAPAASVLLPLRIGQARAEDLLLSGRSIGGAQAASWGLVNELADDPSAAALAYFDAHLSRKSAAAISHAVRAAREPFADLAKARLEDVEALYLEKLMATRDANEGLTAFIEKRQPKWEHR